MTVVPHASETFWDIATWDPVGSGAGYAWAGSSPRLSTKDEGASTAVFDNSGAYVLAAARLAPFSLPATSGVTLSAQIRATGAWSGGTIVSVVIALDSTSSAAVVGTFFDFPTDEWLTFTYAVPAEDLEGYGPFAASGNLIAYALCGPTLPDESYEVSWVQVDVTGTPRLRQRMHGTTSARHRNEQTRRLRARVHI